MDILGEKNRRAMQISILNNVKSNQRLSERLVHRLVNRNMVFTCSCHRLEHWV